MVPAQGLGWEPGATNLQSLLEVEVLGLVVLSMDLISWLSIRLPS
jgi:hypothetical protein